MVRGGVEKVGALRSLNESVSFLRSAFLSGYFFLFFSFSFLLPPRKSFMIYRYSCVGCRYVCDWAVTHEFSFHYAEVGVAIMRGV